VALRPELAKPVPSRTCLLQQHRAHAYAASTPACQGVFWPYPSSPPDRRSFCCRRCCRAHEHAWPSSVNARNPPAIIRILYRRIQSLKCCSRALQPFRFLFSPFCCPLHALHTQTHVRCAGGWVGGIVVVLRVRPCLNLLHKQTIASVYTTGNGIRRLASCTYHRARLPLSLPPLPPPNIKHTSPPLRFSLSVCVCVFPCGATL
jgi:hypothetical protein